MTVAYIGLGANLGDRLSNINRALGLLSAHVKIIRASSVYETEPEGFKEQPDFLNCVVKAGARLDAGALLEVLKGLEKQLGRAGSCEGGPRVIDADLLFYGREVIERPGLVVPHPRIPQRLFVLLPMGEIAPGFIHPVLHKTISRLLNESGSRSRVIKSAAAGLSLAGG